MLNRPLPDPTPADELAAGRFAGCARTSATPNGSTRCAPTSCPDRVASVPATATSAARRDRTVRSHAVLGGYDMARHR